MKKEKSELKIFSTEVRLTQKFAIKHISLAKSSIEMKTPMLDGVVDQVVNPLDTRLREFTELPTDISQWKQLVELSPTFLSKIEGQEKANEEAKHRSSEAVLGIKKIFVKAVSQGVPVVEGLAGVYIDAMISSLSEYVVEEALKEIGGLHMGKGKTASPEVLSVLEEASQPDALKRMLKLSDHIAGGNEASVKVQEELSQIVRTEVKKEFEREIESMKIEQRTIQKLNGQYVSGLVTAGERYNK